MSKIKAIVAVTRNFGIGVDGDILFSFPEDQQRFKKLTLGCVCWLGTGTYKSLPKSIQPYPKRTSFLISKKIKDIREIIQKEELKKDTHIFLFNDINKAYAKSRGHKGDTWITGGEEIYKLTLPNVDVIELTLIDATIPADKFFPNPSKNGFHRTCKGKWKTDPKTKMKFRFERWERRDPNLKEKWNMFWGNYE